MLVRRFLFCALLGCLGQASAATVVISPVTLEINPQRQAMAMTTLVNQGTTPLVFSASLLRWTQQDGQDVNVPTRDAAVNPATFTIAPGRSQVVRIGLRGKSSAPETTYRLLLRQAPTPVTPAATGTEGLQAAITPTYVFSLPLFVTQPSAQANVKTSLERSAAGLTLVLSNSGTAHEVYRNMSTSLNDQPLNLGSVYVLPGSTMRVPLPALPADLKTLVIRSTNRAQQDRVETLNVPAP
ncbi:molecular chaperone [Deinococcus sp. Arct2-2]|uniref:fimbrial biogenesis chaperone n=1 Tax=Deinococcus sp. Arct2-2 TaxID=2568653 RepID=UPI0010A3485F|nr:fimbria/pilus periplasmic chaperone [Deinococcus sp. Arct2-2]THF70353.1 molecular chaperone [Deinococcus sp. Arct2-2]